MAVYVKGDVRIEYQEAGTGFPLLILPGGGLNATMAGLSAASSPFNPMTVFGGQYRCITMDLRNATGGGSNGPSSPTPIATTHVGAANVTSVPKRAKVYFVPAWETCRCDRWTMARR